MTYILILNWNGWGDTIECLESVFRLDHSNYRVIVCDNDSADGSLDRIKAWAEGRLDAAVAAAGALRPLSFPPVAKPIPYAAYTRAQAEAGGRPDDAQTPLILIQTGANLGYAGGNNVGLRYALARGDFDHVWLLNNDTVVAPGALAAMLGQMGGLGNAGGSGNMGGPGNVGMCGSTLLHYHAPDRVALLGGAAFHHWWCLSRPIGRGRPHREAPDPAAARARMAFVSGASMLVSKVFLRDVGLLCEDYFLYFEEIDWARRARGHYGMDFAPESLVYHKEGRAIGSAGRYRRRSLLSDYYLKRNRLIFARKYHPWALPTVYLGLIAAALHRGLIGRWDTARMILGILCGRETATQFGDAVVQPDNGPTAKAP